MKSARDTARVDATNGDPRPTPFDFPAEDRLQSAVQTFGMLGDPTRLRILLTLLEGEQTVNRLAELVGVQQPTVSQHLAKLRMARLVRQRRNGSHMFYEVDGKQVRPLLKQALSDGSGVSQTPTKRTRASRVRNRSGLDGGVASALSGWTLNHGHSLPAALSVGFAINTPVVVGSITVGVILLGPLSRLTSSVVHWFDRLSVSLRYPAFMAAIVGLVGITFGSILVDISRYDPSGPSLAWSPGVAVLSLGAAGILRRISQGWLQDDRLLPTNCPINNFAAAPARLIVPA